MVIFLFLCQPPSIFQRHWVAGASLTPLWGASYGVDLSMVWVRTEALWRSWPGESLSSPWQGDCHFRTAKTLRSPSLQMLSITQWLCSISSFYEMKPRSKVKVHTFSQQDRWDLCPKSQHPFFQPTPSTQPCISRSGSLMNSRPAPKKKLSALPKWWVLESLDMENVCPPGLQLNTQPLASSDCKSMIRISTFLFPLNAVLLSKVSMTNVFSNHC